MQWGLQGVAGRLTRSKDRLNRPHGVVVSVNRGTPMQTKIYDGPYYREPKTVLKGGLYRGRL